VIRHRNKPVTAMLAPEQQFFVYQNIELQLEAARLAMLRGDQVLFDNSLKMTAQWLIDFFDNEANATTALVGEVEKLQKLDVNPALPDISKSLMALRERLKAAKQESAQ
jgi:uroporphyrin-3 C-methyltransferase